MRMKDEEFEEVIRINLEAAFRLMRAAARPMMKARFGRIISITSVVGGYLGYAIGYYLFDTVGQPVLEFYHAMDKYEAFKATFAMSACRFLICSNVHCLYSATGRVIS